MCIIAYKPMGADFPTKRTLQACFNNNPDGAGFMVADGEYVRINKGFMGFRSFWKALRKAREKYGDDKAYVMHFRISTQGGVRQDCCHPFPLSKSMSMLRKLEGDAKIGVAHNGIISLCSTYSKNGKIDYSDTMSFITDYLSLIIKDNDYYKNTDTLDLIEKLCGSRLAILDGEGHCELIGSGWVHDGDMYYSNDTYFEIYRPSVNYNSSKSCVSWYDYDDALYYEDPWQKAIDDYYDSFYNTMTGLYDFTPDECPSFFYGDETYCCACSGECDCYSLDRDVEIPF